MSLTPDKQRKWVIEKIANNFQNYPEISDKSWYKVDEHETDPCPETQRDIVEKVLAIFKAIRIISRKKSRHGAAATEKNANWYDIEIISPKFDELCVEYGVKFVRRLDKNSCHFVSFNEIRVIALDDKYKLSKPNLNSENDHFFSYVFKNPDKKITAEEIEQEEKATIGKNFANTLNDLGFKGEIKKIFFTASKDTVIFRNFVPKSKLHDLGINEEKLQQQIEGLERL